MMGNRCTPLAFILFQIFFRNEIGDSLMGIGESITVPDFRLVLASLVVFSIATISIIRNFRNLPRQVRSLPLAKLLQGTSGKSFKKLLLERNEMDGSFFHFRRISSLDWFRRSHSSFSSLSALTKRMGGGAFAFSSVSTSRNSPILT